MALFSFKAVVCSFHSEDCENLKLYEDMFQQKFHSLSHVHKNMSWYYNKSIIRGDTSDIIVNVFVKFWKTPSRITFKNIGSF